MHLVYLLTGSNLGDRAAQLGLCLEAVRQRAGSIMQVSSVYETAAWGLEGLPPHLNQAILIRTELAPLDLLQVLQQIEQDLGRVKQEKWGVRAIDIDIIYYDQEAVNLPELVIPHPLMQLRRFVLTPLAEIAPRYEHPLLHKTNQELEQECSDPLPVVPVKAA